MMLRRQMLNLQRLAGWRAVCVPDLPGCGRRTPFKVGLIVPMTGQQASTGKQIDAAVKLYQAQHGTSVAGKKIEVILKDDGRHSVTTPSASRRGTDRQRQGSAPSRVSA